MSSKSSFTLGPGDEPSRVAVGDAVYLAPTGLLRRTLDHAIQERRGTLLLQPIGAQGARNSGNGHSIRVQPALRQASGA